MEGHTSLFSEAIKAVAMLGIQNIPDPNEYGKIAAPIQVLYDPLDMLRDCWDPISLYLRSYDNGIPQSWPFMLIGATRNFIPRTKGTIDPNLIVPLVMHTAVTMSIVDPARICSQSTREGKKTVDIGRTELGRLLQSNEFKAALEAAKSGDVRK